MLTADAAICLLESDSPFSALKLFCTLRSTLHTLLCTHTLTSFALRGTVLPWRFRRLQRTSCPDHLDGRVSSKSVSRAWEAHASRALSCFRCGADFLQRSSRENESNRVEHSLRSLRPRQLSEQCCLMLQRDRDNCLAVYHALDVVGSSVLLLIFQVFLSCFSFLLHQHDGRPKIDTLISFSYY